MFTNISIPAGAEVQQQTWQVWFQDSGGTNSGEKGRATMNLAVTEQFGVSLTSQTPLLADTPAKRVRSHSSTTPECWKPRCCIQSRHNSEDGWSAVVENETGVSVPNPIVLGKAEVTNLFLNVTADAPQHRVLYRSTSEQRAHPVVRRCSVLIFLAGTSRFQSVRHQYSDQNTYQSAADGT